jgi:hypothetical protein
MAWFVTWGIRVPAFLAGALFLFAGATAVIDWSLAFTGAALFGFVVEGAGHFRRKPRIPETTSTAIEEPVDEAAILQYRIASLEEDDEEAAA